MIFLHKQWKKVVAATSEVDLTFLLLRIFSLVGGVSWLLIVHLPQREETILFKSLIFFFTYSLLCYLIIFFKPALLKKVYLASLVLDMIFLSNLIHAEPNFVSSFFLGYYLLLCLHTIYFGLRFGLIVAAFSAVCYGVSILSVPAHIEWTDLAMRISFLFFITVPVGLITEKAKRDKRRIENFNKTLESTVNQRTEKIRALLDKERYLQEILNTVAHINKLLIISPNLVSLLESSCTRFVQHGHYGFSWIGLLEDNVIKTIHTSETKGSPLVDPPYEVFDADSLFYSSSAAQCIRENRIVIHQNVIGAADQNHWRDRAALKEFQAIISLPLRAPQSGESLGVLCIYSWRKEGFAPEEQDMLADLAGDISFAIDSFRQRESVTKLTAERAANYEETIFSFVDMIEQRDTYTAGHSERVANYCQLIAREMGFEFEEIKKVYKSAILHDIGKIATPDSVLLKPGKLTTLDYDLIKLHPFAGYEMLSKIEMYKELAVIILHHHERHDGNGYPDGLRGEKIPPLSRIMSVSDAFDAMTTNRIYKARKEIPQALDELRYFSGTQFHPDVVRAAVRVLADIKISTGINQLPVTNLEKKRFSYFFNDKLTGLYNEVYLKSILNNLDLKNYTCMHMLHLLNVPEYNKRHGWDKGNQFFKDFAAELQVAFPEALAFRVYGNDFVLISPKHFDIDSRVFDGFKCIFDDEIQVEVRHFKLLAGNAYTIDKLDKLEILPVTSRQPMSEATKGLYETNVGKMG